MKRALSSSLLLLLAASLLSGCESGHDRYLRAEARRKAAQEQEDKADAAAHQGALRALERRKQNELDAIEQHRTLNATSHSCRKAVAIDPGFPVSIDTSGCSPEQLRAEQESEREMIRQEAEKKGQEIEYNGEQN